MWPVSKKEHWSRESVKMAPPYLLIAKKYAKCLATFPLTFGFKIKNN